MVTYLVLSKLSLAAYHWLSKYIAIKVVTVVHLWLVLLNHIVYCLKKTLHGSFKANLLKQLNLVAIVVQYF